MTNIIWTVENHEHCHEMWEVMLSVPASIVGELSRQQSNVTGAWSWYTTGTYAQRETARALAGALERFGNYRFAQGMAEAFRRNKEREVMVAKQEARCQGGQP